MVINLWDNLFFDVNKYNFYFIGFGSEFEEVEESEGSGGLESDEDEEDKKRLLNAKEGIELEEDGSESGKRISVDEGGL